MNLQEIHTGLDAADFQYRLKAVSALKAYDAEIAVPLLLSKVNDAECLVRSFVAMGLGKQQTMDSYGALLQMMRFDQVPNVRAEAANSLSLFGPFAAPLLLITFVRDDHWLVRYSILGALVDLVAYAELFEACLVGLTDEDLKVQETSVDALGFLAGSSSYAHLALEQLLTLLQQPLTAEQPTLRVHLAGALKHFDAVEAKAAIATLRDDPDHRVVAATLETLLPE
jgi:HEAT repeat protein